MSSDAYGASMLSYLATGSAPARVVERDDGFMETTRDPSPYFAQFRDWPQQDRRAMRYVRGRVLDVGCGAGRFSLYLQQRGFSVLGIDSSAGAVEVSRRRGVRDARHLPLDEINATLGTFDTVLLLGGTLGLLADTQKAHALLCLLDRITTERGRVIGESRNPHATADPQHLAYHARNRNLGRLPGQVRLRVRYGDDSTPWFDYLLVSPAELDLLLQESSWRRNHVIQGEGGLYIAVIDKIVSR